MRIDTCGSISLRRYTRCTWQLQLCTGTVWTAAGSNMCPQLQPAQEAPREPTFLQGQLSSQVQVPAHSHFSPQGIFAVG